MKVARFHPVRPVQTISELFGTTGSGPSGQVLTATGSNSSSVAWGSNVATITSNGSNVLVGPYVGLQSGSGIAFAASSNILTISSTSGGGGGASVSFGSNATRVSEVSSAGASTDSARADHIHDGIGTITASSSNTVQRGTFNLRAGSGIALSLTDTDGDGEFDTTTIVNTGQGGGGGGSSTADAVRNQIGNGEIVIPGLAASPDIRVAGTNDQEFDSSTIGGTALGSPTTIDANTTFKSHLYIKKAAATGFSLQGRYWTTPSTPFTMTGKLTDWSNTKSNFMRVGMGIAEATPGKTEAIYVDGNNPAISGSGVVSVISSTTPTTGAAYVQQGNNGVEDATHAPMYFRVVVVSSTDVTWYFSTGGLIWRRLAGANRNPGFTIGSYFLSAHPENATYDMEAAFDWVRFT